MRGDSAIKLSRALPEIYETLYDSVLRNFRCKICCECAALCGKPIIPLLKSLGLYTDPVIVGTLLIYHYTLPNTSVTGVHYQTYQLLHLNTMYNGILLRYFQGTRKVPIQISSRTLEVIQIPLRSFVPSSAFNYFESLLDH